MPPPQPSAAYSSLAGGVPVFPVVEAERYRVDVDSSDDEAGFSPRVNGCISLDAEVQQLPTRQREHYVRDMGLMMEDGHVPLPWIRPRSFRSAGALMAFVLSLVATVVVATVLLLRTDGEGGGLRRGSGRLPLTAFEHGQSEEHTMVWMAYDQFKIENLRTVHQIDGIADKHAAQAYAEQHNYSIFSLDVQRKVAMFKASLDTVWSVRKRGPLTKYDLKYLGYWSPEVLYIRRVYKKPCKFAGVVCGFGFSTAKVVYCPEDLCTTNECCTSMTPFDKEEGSPAEWTTTTSAARAATSTTVITATTTMTGDSGTVPVTSVPPASTTTTTATTTTVTTTSKAQKKHRSVKRTEVDDAELELEDEYGASGPTKFDVFRVSLDFESSMTQDELEAHEAPFALAVADMVRDKTPDAEEVNGWGDAHASLNVVGDGGTEGMNRCKVDVLLALQGKTKAAMEHVRQAVDDVRGDAPDVLMEELRRRLEEVPKGRRLLQHHHHAHHGDGHRDGGGGHRHGDGGHSSDSGSHDDGRGEGDDSKEAEEEVDEAEGGSSLLPWKHGAELANRIRHGYRDARDAVHSGYHDSRDAVYDALGIDHGKGNATDRGQTHCVSGGLVCRIDSVDTLRSENAGVFDQYDNYWVFAQYFVGALVAVVVALVCLVDFTPYRVKVRFTVLVQHCDPCEPLSEAGYLALQRSISNEAGGGVEVGDVHLKLLTDSSSSGADKAKALADKSTADMVFQVQPAHIKAYSTWRVTVDPPGARQTYAAKAALSNSRTLADSICKGLEVALGHASVLEAPFEGGASAAGNYFGVKVHSKLVITGFAGNFHTSSSQKCSVWLRGGKLGDSPGGPETGWDRVAWAPVSGVGWQEVPAECALEPGDYTFFFGASGGGVHTTRRTGPVDMVIAEDLCLTITSGYSTREALVPHCGRCETASMAWNGGIRYSRISQVSQQKISDGESLVSPASRGSSLGSAPPSPSGGVGASIPCAACRVVRAWWGCPGSEWTTNQGALVTGRLRNALRSGTSVVIGPELLGDPAPGQDKVLVIDAKQSAVGVVRADARGAPLQSGDAVYLRSAATGRYVRVQGSVAEASCLFPTEAHRFVFTSHGTSGAQQQLRSGSKVAVQAGGSCGRYLEVIDAGDTVMLRLNDLLPGPDRPMAQIDASRIVRAWYGQVDQPWVEGKGQDVSSKLKRALSTAPGGGISAIATATRLGFFGDPVPGCQMEVVLEVTAASWKVTAQEQTIARPLVITQPGFAVLAHGRALCSGETICLHSQSATGACKYICVDGSEVVAHEGLRASSNLVVERGNIHLVERSSVFFRPLEGSTHIEARKEEYRRSQWVLPLLLFGSLSLAVFLGSTSYTPYRRAREACLGREDVMAQARCAAKVFKRLRALMLKVFSEAAAPPLIPLPPLAVAALVMIFAIWWQRSGAYEEVHADSSGREEPVMWRFEAAMRRNELMRQREEVEDGRKRAALALDNLSLRRILRHPCRSCRRLLQLPIQKCSQGFKAFLGGLRWLCSLSSCRERLHGILLLSWGFCKVLGRTMEVEFALKLLLGVQCCTAASMMVFLGLVSTQGNLPAKYAWNPMKLGLELLVCSLIQRLSHLPLSLARGLGAIGRYALCRHVGEGVYETEAAEGYLKMYASMLRHVCSDLSAGAKGLPQATEERAACAFVDRAADKTDAWLDAYRVARSRRFGLGILAQIAFKGCIARRQDGLEKVAQELLLKDLRQRTQAELLRAVTVQETYNRRLCKKILSSLPEVQNSQLTVGVLKEELSRLKTCAMAGISATDRLKLCTERRMEIESSLKEMLLCGSTREVGLAPDEGGCMIVGLILANIVSAILLYRVLYLPVRDACDRYDELFDTPMNPITDVVFGAGIVSFLNQLPLSHTLGLQLFSVFMYEPSWRHSAIQRLRFRAPGDVDRFAQQGLGGMRLISESRVAAALSGGASGVDGCADVPFEDVGWGLVVLACFIGVLSWGCCTAAVLLPMASSPAALACGQALNFAAWALGLLRGAFAGSAVLVLVVGSGFWRSLFPARVLKSSSCEPACGRSRTDKASGGTDFKSNCLQAVERLISGVLIGGGTGMVLGLDFGPGEAAVSTEKQLVLGMIGGWCVGTILGLTGAVDRRPTICLALTASGLLLGMDLGALVVLKAALHEYSAAWGGTLCTRTFAGATFIVAVILNTLRSCSGPEQEAEPWQVVPGSARIAGQGGEASRRVVLCDPRLGNENRPGIPEHEKPNMKIVSGMVSKVLPAVGGSHFSWEQWREGNCSLLEVLKCPLEQSPAAAVNTALRAGMASGILAAGFAFVATRLLLGLGLPLSCGLAAITFATTLVEVAPNPVEEPDEVVFCPSNASISIEVRRQTLSWPIRTLLCLADFTLNVDPGMPFEPPRTAPLTIGNGGSASIEQHGSSVAAGVAASDNCDSLRLSRGPLTPSSTASSPASSTPTGGMPPLSPAATAPVMTSPMAAAGATGESPPPSPNSRDLMLVDTGNNNNNNNRRSRRKPPALSTIEEP